MRFSDLKKKQGTDLPPEDAAPRPVEAPVARKPAPPPPPPPPPPAAPVVSPSERAAERAVERAADARQSADQRLVARAAYGRGIALLRQVFSNSGPQPEGLFPSLAQFADELIDLTKSANQHLLVLTACVTSDEPAVAHSLNAAILAVKLAVGLKLERADLKPLALTALLHDLGRPRSYRLGLQKGLAPGEAVRIRDSLRSGDQQLARFPDAPPDFVQNAAATIAQLHSGAPADKAAQIIALCDLYEAMTHGYDGTAPVHPRDAFKTLVGLKENYDHALVKQLLEALSPFPPGSLVKLVDGRVGCVVAINGKMLTRPIVEIWLHADGKAQEPPVSVDLVKELMIGITGPPDEAKVAASPAAGRLRSLRFWTDSAE